MNIRNDITKNYEIFFRLFGDKTKPNKPKVANNQSSLIDNQLRRQTQFQTQFLVSWSNLFKPIIFCNPPRERNFSNFLQNIVALFIILCHITAYQ
jgi:hypothetical protein